MALTVSDLKVELKDYNYRMLTGGDDDVAARALQRALIWAKAKIIATSGSFDPDTEINREIVLKRALYELYSHAENEAVASDKREDAMELLRAVYGSGVDSAGYQQGGGAGDAQPSPSAAVVSKERNKDFF
nr:hypothetical protein [uncultured Sphaerochaeta sp.]